MTPQDAHGHVRRRARPTCPSRNTRRSAVDRPGHEIARMFLDVSQPCADNGGRPSRSVAHAMRLAAALIVLAHLVLRGVVVPCAAHAEHPHHARRPHVHLTGHVHRNHHGDAHESHGHHHDRARTADAGSGFPNSAPGPDHDDDAVYFADDAVMCFASCRSMPTTTALQWLATPPLPVFGAPAIVEPRPRHVRPPGVGAATIHTLLPHVLRV